MKKSVGIVWVSDNQFRVTLPKSIRDVLDLPAKSSVEIFLDDNCVVMRKYSPGCVFCGQVDGTTLYRHRPICETCRQELAQWSRERTSVPR
ncbi:AbrB/MazE/SpoVT family DNA-binding domain-containing protein [Alicyclobacillus vulcanalis]|uniref:AbrB/MazE/SpoVT family DNA-binding domain-containing protein n=1 Tax=Alicyclobacillus vulcanalis TaxID=252246 RepID=UPI0009714831